MASADQFSGYIFMCSGTTKADCFRYRVFGLPAGRLSVVKKIQPGMKLFLYDVSSKLLYGVYNASSHGDKGLEPSAFKGSYPAQVKFGIFKECLPLPENVFKHAIKDNYQGGRKFRTELSDEQVNNLVSMFRPLFPQVSDGQYAHHGQVVRHAMYTPGQDCPSYFPEHDHQQRHSRHNNIEGRASEFPSYASAEYSEYPKQPIYYSQNVPQQTSAMGSESRVSELIRGLHETIVQSGGTHASLDGATPASMPTHSYVPLQNAGDLHASLNDSTHPSSHASMSTHSNATLQNYASPIVFTQPASSTGPDGASTGYTSHGFAHPTSSSQAAAYSNVVPYHQTQQQYQVSTATHNMPYNGAQLQTQGGSAVVESAYPSVAYWQGVPGQEFHGPYQANSTAHFWPSGNDQTAGSVTYGTYHAYAPIPTQEHGVAHGMTQYQYASSNYAPPSVPYGTQNQAYYGHC